MMVISSSSFIELESFAERACYDRNSKPTLVDEDSFDLPKGQMNYVVNNEFRLFCTNMLKKDCEFHKFCDELNNYISELYLQNQKILLSNQVISSPTYSLSMDVYGDKKFIHDIKYTFKNMRELDATILSSNYIMIGLLSRYKQYARSLRQILLEKFNISENIVKKCIISSYKEIHKAFLTEHNSRLRAEAHVFIYSENFKTQFCHVRRNMIRPQIVQHIRSMKKIASMDDIQWFLQESEFEDILNS